MGAAVSSSCVCCWIGWWSAEEGFQSMPAESTRQPQNPFLWRSEALLNGSTTRGGPRGPTLRGMGAEISSSNALVCRISEVVMHDGCDASFVPARIQNDAASARLAADRSDSIRSTVFDGGKPRSGHVGTGLNASHKYTNTSQQRQQQPSDVRMSVVGEQQEAPGESARARDVSIQPLLARSLWLAVHFSRGPAVPRSTAPPQPDVAAISSVCAALWKPRGPD